MSLAKILRACFRCPTSELSLSRDEHEAIHRKLDLILEGQGTVMAQQDELMETLTAISTEVDTLAQHSADLEKQLADKAADLGIDLSPELTLAKQIRSRLENVATVVATTPAPAEPTGDTPAPTDTAGAEQQSS